MAQMKRVLALGTAVLAASCNERPEVAYPNRAAVEAHGAIRRGWIPDWIPKSSRDLHEMHDLDTNKSMLVFQYDPKEQIQFGGACEAISPGSVPRAPFRAGWWRFEGPPSELAQDRQVLYSCEAGRAYLAIEAKKGEVYYWRP